MTDNKCPECGRDKAWSLDQVIDGLCPKNWAYRDPDAYNDCKIAQIRKERYNAKTS